MMEENDQFILYQTKITKKFKLKFHTGNRSFMFRSRPYNRKEDALAGIAKLQATVRNAEVVDRTT